MVTCTERRPHSCCLATWTDRLGLSCMLFAHCVRSVKYASTVHSAWVCVHPALSNSLRPCGLQPFKLLCPRDFPGKNTAVGCHFPLQGINPTQGSNPSLLCPFFTAEPLGKPVTLSISIIKYTCKYEFYASFLLWRQQLYRNKGCVPFTWCPSIQHRAQHWEGALKTSMEWMDAHPQLPDFAPTPEWLSWTLGSQHATHRAFWSLRWVRKLPTHCWPERTANRPSRTPTNTTLWTMQWIVTPSIIPPYFPVSGTSCKGTGLKCVIFIFLPLMFFLTRLLSCKRLHPQAIAGPSAGFTKTDELKLGEQWGPRLRENTANTKW